MKDSHGKLPCWMSKPPTNWWLSMAVFHRPRWERLCESHGHSWSLGSKMLTGFHGEPAEWVVNSWTIFFASSMGIPTNQLRIWFCSGNLMISDDLPSSKLIVRCGKADMCRSFFQGKTMSFLDLCLTPVAQGPGVTIKPVGFKWFKLQQDTRMNQQPSRIF